MYWVFLAVLYFLLFEIKEHKYRKHCCTECEQQYRVLELGKVDIEWRLNGAAASEWKNEESSEATEQTWFE